MAQQWIHRRMVPGEVTILFSSGVEAGVEITPATARRQDANVFRQKRMKRGPV